MRQKKRTLITGAGGFIGSHLADRFLAEGWRVTGVDNLITGTRRNLEHLGREPRFDFVERDICQPLDPIAGPIDAVLDFASPASPIRGSRTSRTSWSGSRARPSGPGSRC